MAATKVTGRKGAPMGITRGLEAFGKTLAHKLGNGLQWSDFGVCSHKSLSLYTQILSNSRYLTTRLRKQIDRVFPKASKPLRHSHLVSAFPEKLPDWNPK